MDDFPITPAPPPDRTIYAAALTPIQGGAQARRANPLARWARWLWGLVRKARL